VSFQVSTNNDAAFAALPVVEPSGTLNYTPQTTLSQIDASVTVEALDSGGATSDPQVFTITIDP
jgi:hypothetical protein